MIVQGPRLYFGRGARIDIFNFTAEDLHPVWMGVALSRIARFAGAGVHSVSVAAHSKTLSHLVGDCIHRQRAALIHDVPEIFTGDVPSPIKRSCADLMAVDHRITERLSEVFGVPMWAFEAIEPADRAIADDEKLFMFDDLSPEDRATAEANRLGIVVTPMPRHVAAAAWTRRFYALFSKEDQAVA